MYFFFFSPTDAVIVAEPSFFALTLPFESTVAIFVLLDFQVIFWEVPLTDSVELLKIVMLAFVFDILGVSTVTLHL